MSSMATPAGASTRLDAADYIAFAAALDESAADALLTPRELQVRQRAREVVAVEIAPRAEETDREHSFAHAGVHALANAGLGGIIFPENLGGSGDTNVAYAVAMEEVAAGCASTSLVYMTQTHAAYPIWRAGTRELADRYVPPLLQATSYGSLAITEPEAGSDAASLRTRATRSASDHSYRLTGSKTFITTGDKAEVIICFATVDASRGRRGITAFVVDGSSSGLTRGQPFLKMGMHGSSTAELFFDAVEVASSNRLGEEGEGWAVLMASVVKSRISAAAQGVGIARAAYAQVLRSLRSLHGTQLPDEATFALADLRGEILQGRLLLHAIAREIDRTETPSTGQIGIMKQCCTDLGFRASVAAARILGPYGDLAMHVVERCVRDAKITQIYDGTNEVQRMLIGRETARAIGELL